MKSQKKAARPPVKKTSVTKGTGVPPVSGSAADHVELPDGSKVPVGIPPGMDPAVASQVIDYLKANPEAARQSLDTAHRLMRTPGMAQQMLEAQRLSATASPEQKAKLLLLKDDPELKHVFEDIQSSGAEVMEKYWNDTELMSKIAAKMGELNMGPAKRPTPSSQVKLGTLHAAAKAGDADILRGLIDGGADVNQADARGISALGVAVGFNRLPAVQALLAAGARIDQPDGRGNTVLHYAAGYGRKEVAELLLEAGADAGARNAGGQRPVDVAEVNREMHMVAYLRARAGADAEPVAAKFL